MIYSIKQGAHSCSPRRVKLLDSSKPRTGTFLLKKECWYDTKTYGDHLNKLVGVGCDIFNSYSYRLSWRPAPEVLRFEIHLYLHIDGKWVRSKPLRDDLCAVVGAENRHNFSFDPSGENIRALVNGEGVTRHFPFSKGNGWFMQFSYGGKPVAPWSMSAEITMDGI